MCFLFTFGIILQGQTHSCTSRCTDGHLPIDTLTCGLKEPGIEPVTFCVELRGPTFYVNTEVLHRVCTPLGYGAFLHMPDVSAIPLLVFFLRYCNNVGPGSKLQLPNHTVVTS